MFVNAAPEEFRILVQRESVTNNLVTGSIYINNECLGPCYERNDKRILPGTYPGFVRYGSTKGFAQGPFGELGQHGDFLLEIGEVKWSDGTKRSNLLFHGGNKPGQSQGCIMLGPVKRDSNGLAILPDNHPLRLLRLRFYGADMPLSTPNKHIEIVIRDIATEKVPL